MPLFWALVKSALSFKALIACFIAYVTDSSVSPLVRHLLTKPQPRAQITSPFQARHFTTIQTLKLMDHKHSFLDHTWRWTVT